MRNGFLQYSDARGKYVNFVNGEQYTLANPIEFENTLFLFGACTVQGYYVDDCHTLGSYLRNVVDKKYYIKNCGFFYNTINYVMRINQEIL
jgi:hypothetical protein